MKDDVNTKFVFKAGNFFVLLVILFASCGKQTPLLKPHKLKGLNDSAYYYVSKKNEVFYVMKAEYEKNKDLNVILVRDTIILGQTFSADVVVDHKNFSISLEKPTEESFSNEPKSVRWTYNYIPDKEGLFLFKGVVRYDSLVTPFEYKVLVIPKKN